MRVCLEDQALKMGRVSFSRIKSTFGKITEANNLVTVVLNYHFGLLAQIKFPNYRCKRRFSQVVFVHNLVEIERKKGSTLHHEHFFTIEKQILHWQVRHFFGFRLRRFKNQLEGLGRLSLFFLDCD